MDTDKINKAHINQLASSQAFNINFFEKSCHISARHLAIDEQDLKMLLRFAHVSELTRISCKDYIPSEDSVKIF